MIEVALGYRTIQIYQELAPRVEALGPAVTHVVYVGSPAAWLVRVSESVSEHDAAAVLNLRDAGAGAALAIMPFSLYERLLLRTKQSNR